MAETYGVRTDFVGLETWLKVRTKNKDQKCSDCKKLYIEIGESLCVVHVPGKANRHTCKQCALKHIAKGAVDFTKIIEESKNMKQELIDKIMSLRGHSYKTSHSNSYNKYYDLTQKGLEELQLIYDEIVVEDARLKDIDEDVLNYVETETEEYLKKDYNVYESHYLKSPLQIEDHFKEDSHDFFDCGQGYYQDEAEVLVKIGNKFYNVKLYAEIGSEKQDRGDRLYWVEKIRSVKYSEVDKPLPKSREDRTVVFKDVSSDDMSKLMVFLRENNMECKEI